MIRVSGAPARAPAADLTKADPKVTAEAPQLELGLPPESAFVRVPGAEPAPPTLEERRVAEALAQLVAQRALDAREVLLTARPVPAGRGLALIGEATDAAAAHHLVEAVRTLLAPLEVEDRLTRHPSFDDPAAPRLVVTTPELAVNGEPRWSTAKISTHVLGAELQELGREGAWVRVRGVDGYIGWVHGGGVTDRPDAAPELPGRWMRSVDATLADPVGAPSLPLPLGSRLFQAADGRLLLPGGASAQVASGKLVPEQELSRLFPADGQAVVKSAREWLGTHYEWGGVSPGNGTDCSGFVQSVFRLHGVELPRDASQQVRVGEPVDPGPEYLQLRPGDVLFFTDKKKIDHVGISLGGSEVIHASPANPGVAISDLRGAGKVDGNLRERLVAVRRVLP
jgi:gamma-D-glutamyl-L-lysine dipeptidyl-peptidase